MAEKTIPEYIDQLKSKDSDERREAVMFLTKQNNPGVIDYILPLATDPDAAVRYYVKKSLASLEARRKQQDGEVLPTESISHDIRDKIVQIQNIAASGDSSSVDMLLGQLAMEEDRFLKATLIKALGTLGDVEVASSLVPFLKDPDHRVVANTVEALEELEDPESQLAMLDLLTHPDTRVKGNVAKALWSYSQTDSIGSTLILDRLREMLESDKPWYRESAVFVLGKIGTERAIALLRISLTDPDENIQKMAKDIFQQIEDAKKIDQESVWEEIEKPAAEVVPEKVKPILHVEKKNKLIGGSTLPEKEPFFERIWSPHRTLNENLVASVIFMLLSLGTLFLLMIVVNVAYLLPQSSAPNQGNVIAISPMDAELERWIIARRYEKIIALLASRETLTDNEKYVLSEAYEKTYFAHLEEGNLEGMKNVLTNWCTVLGESTRGHLLLGNYLLRYEEDNEGAREHFNFVLKKELRNAEAAIGLGDIALLSDRPKDALKFYERAVKCDEHDARAHFALGSAQAHTGDFAGAESQYREAIRISPLHTMAHLGLGKILRKKGKLEEARREFEIAVGLDGKMGWPRFELAQLIGDKDPGRKLQLLEEAVELSPNEALFLKGYGQALLELKVNVKAVQILETYIKKNPMDADILAALGGAWLTQNNGVRGLELIQRALKITPEHGLANYNRALLHEAMGEAEEALTCYHLALAAGYQPIACLSSMSTMLMTRNRNEEAKKMLVKGLTQFPKNPWLRFNLALAHRELKELDESREVLGLLHPELQGTDIFFQNKVRDVMKELGMPIPNEQSNDTASDNTVGE